MRRTPALAVLVGALAWACSPAPAAAGVWVTLAAGLPGGSAPTSDTEFWFDSPHAPPVVAVTALTGGTTAEAGTGGGTVFFGGAGTPVLLDVGGGSAYIAGGSPPEGATARGPHGGSAGTPSATAPTAGGAVPTDAALLGIALADPLADGSRLLTASVTNAAGTVLGNGTVVVPDGGWWVLGLTPGEQLPPPPPVPVDPPPVVDPTPTPNPDPVDPFPPVTPTPIPVPPTPVPPGPVATPEPSTMVLVGLGGLAVGAWRRTGGRRSPSA